LQHIKAGSVKPLAVMTDRRIADLPNVPTIAEAGFPEATYVPWYGIYVQAGTPDAIAAKINDGSTRRCRILKCSASSPSPISQASRCRWPI
jgi:tripartite-type tricarboxylate transporter receptor subunit TctC